MSSTSPTAREYFDCARYRARLTRGACAELARKAVRCFEGRPGADALSLPVSEKCRGCAIGLAHAAGKAHADAPTVAPIKPLADARHVHKPRLCAHCGDPIPVRRLALNRRETCSQACASEWKRVPSSASADPAEQLPEVGT
jgi:hypothetical protein